MEIQTHEFRASYLYLLFEGAWSKKDSGVVSLRLVDYVCMMHLSVCIDTTGMYVSVWVINVHVRMV